MTRSNHEFRNDVAQAGVKLWEIAYKLGYTDSHFTRIMRKEFTDDMRERAYKALSELKSEREVS